VPCTSPRVCSVPGVIRSLLPVALPEENLDATPRAHDGIGVGPGVWIEKMDAVVHSAMHVTEIAVRTPGITDDRSVWVRSSHL